MGGPRAIAANAQVHSFVDVTRNRADFETTSELAAYSAAKGSGVSLRRAQSEAGRWSRRRARAIWACALRE